MPQTESETARKAKLFRNGRNRAVRIPREFDFAADAVFIARRGEELILSARPLDWSALMHSKEVATENFLRKPSSNRAWGGL
jgi:antitoxin VapB